MNDQRAEQKRIEQEILEFLALQPDASGTVDEIAQQWISACAPQVVYSSLEHLCDCNLLARYGYGDGARYFAPNENLVRIVSNYVRFVEE